MKLTRRKFVKGMTSGAGLLVTGLKQTPGATITTTQNRRTRRPNVVFILADDLGWGDLSCYGRPDYRTPNLDLLASQGTKLTDAYSASAVCTPTRVGFITDRYPARLKIGLLQTMLPINRSMGLDPGHPKTAPL